MGNSSATRHSLRHRTRQLGCPLASIKGLHRGEEEAGGEGWQKKLGPQATQPGNDRAEQEVWHASRYFLASQCDQLHGFGGLRLYFGNKDSLKRQHPTWKCANRVSAPRSDDNAV